MQGISDGTVIWPCRVEDVEKLDKSPLIAKEIPIYGVIYHCEASVCAWQACMIHPTLKAGCQCVGFKLPMVA